MPYKEGIRFRRDRFGILRAWIDQGAIWPETAITNAGLRRSIGLYRGPNAEECSLSQRKGVGACGNQIDALSSNEWKKTPKVKPSAEADR